jgi:endonuclease YncB( thermonuclease family)
VSVEDVTVQSHGKDKYGRTLGDVFLLDKTHVNHTLVTNGRSWVKLRSAKLSRKSSTQHDS